MRVQESKQTSKNSIMGKKKHKLRKQAKENELCPSDSSDDGGNAGRCPHLAKSINFNTMRKALKQLGSIGDCASCESDRPVRGAESRTDDPVSGGATGGVGEVIMEEMFEAIEPTIWVCLQCGHQGCDRNSKEQHALKHFQTPRSSMHAVVVNVNTWVTWCYSCDDEVSADSSRKLQECLEFLRKQAASTTSATSGTAPTTVNRSSSFKAEGGPGTESGSTDAIAKVEAKPAKPKPISLQAAASVTQGLPKVKGLSNLGNTCFFNAVMQNLSQTYMLEMLLGEKGIKGAVLNLPGHKPESDSFEESLSDASSGSDDESDDRKLDLPPFSISLSDPGALTQSLVSFMKDMHNPSKVGTISPNNLFGQVCKKAPRFKGFQQQDSHELLRHLLDGMKAEEIKRSQAAILKQFHLAENTNPKKVDDDTKIKVKEYGRQAKHTFVDSVFGGVFISTVQCEECHVPSQVFEPFLDISLPILEEKTVRPNNMWSWRKKEEADKGKTSAMDELAASSDRGPSKHQQKKAKRQSKKDAKKKTKTGGATAKEAEQEEAEPMEEGVEATEEGAEPAAEGAEPKVEAESKLSEAKDRPKGDSRSPSDQEMSDADVEDNIESDASRNRFIRLNSHEDVDTATSPTELPRLGGMPSEGSASCSSISCAHNDRSDSTGRSEESTLTEPSAGERTGCSSIASLSDSTCKASSVDSPFGSNTGLNQASEPSSPRIAELAEGVKKLELSENVTAQSSVLKKISEMDSSSKEGMDKRSEPSSNGSLSLDGTEETTSASNGHHRSSSHRSRSSGYSSGATSKSGGAASACSRSQLRLEAKFKAMSCLAPRYHAQSQECSVMSCLNQFTSAELLTGSNKFGCETCTKRKYGNSGKEGKKDTVYTNASKQLLLFQPPACLTLHLKRFQQVGYTLRKVNRHVEFPMLLDLAPYCSSLCKGVKPGQTKVLYSLYGVVEHSGRLTGGHYTAYVKVRPRSNRLGQFINNQDALHLPVDRLLETLHSSQQDLTEHDVGGSGDGGLETEATPAAGKWYYISDSRVTEVSNEASVLRCQAYLLFYERIL